MLSRNNLREIVLRVPRVQTHLLPALLQSLFGEVKTLEYFQVNINHLVRSVYDGFIGGEFVDILGNLITGQMRDAYQRAWVENDGQGNLPEYLTVSLEEFTNKNINFDYIYQYYKDIIDARVDQAPIGPLLDRASLWSNRYNEAYNLAVSEITEANGGKLIWVYGEAEHCQTCADLNGIIAFASEWTASGYHPQGAPNDKLECGGWRCKCKLEPTKKRRSPRAAERLAGLSGGGE